MRNWKYINGAEVGNSIYSELNKDNKRVVIESDGSWYVYDKNDKIVEQGRESNADNALGKFKAKGYNKKTCNSDGVARMFQGLVKDEDKDEKHYEGAIDDLEKVGNKVGNIQFAGDYYDIKQEPDGNFYIYVNGGAKTYGPYRSKGEAEGKLKSILAERNRTGNSYSDKLPTAMDYRKALDEIIEKKNLNPDEARKKYGQFTYAQWEKELGHKIGNSEDEKFAYVMREFEEGKLKSSSGETVTDPAQAKAIAYSESKKAENGLKRARKAIH